MFFSSPLSLWRPSSKVPPLRFPLLPAFPSSSLSSTLRPRSSFSTKFGGYCYSPCIAGRLSHAGRRGDCKNEDFARFKGKSVLSCNSTRFPWQPFIRLFSVAMATHQKLALSLSLCPNSFFFFFIPPPSSPKAPLCEMTQALAWWNCRHLLRKLDLML